MAQDVTIRLEFDDRDEGGGAPQPTQAPSPSPPTTQPNAAPPEPPRVPAQYPPDREGAKDAGDISGAFATMGGGAASRGAYENIFAVLEGGGSDFTRKIEAGNIAKAKPLYEAGAIGSAYELYQFGQAGFDANLYLKLYPERASAKTANPAGSEAREKAAPAGTPPPTPPVAAATDQPVPNYLADEVGGEAREKAAPVGDVPTISEAERADLEKQFGAKAVADMVKSGRLTMQAPTTTPSVATEAGQTAEWRREAKESDPRKKEAQDRLARTVTRHAMEADAGIPELEPGVPDFSLGAEAEGEAGEPPPAGRRRRGAGAGGGEGSLGRSDGPIPVHLVSPVPLPVNVLNFPAEVASRGQPNGGGLTPRRKPAGKPPKRPKGQSPYAGLSKMFHRAGMPKVAGMFGAFEEMDKRRKKKFETAADKAEAPDDAEPSWAGSREWAEKTAAAKEADQRPETKTPAGERPTQAALPEEHVFPKKGGEGQIPEAMNAGEVGDVSAAAEGGLADVAADVAPELLLAKLAAQAVAEGFDDLRAGVKLVGDDMVDLAGNNYLGAFNKQVEAGADALKKVPIVGDALASGLEAAVQPVRSFADVVQAVVSRGQELAGYSGDIAQAGAVANVREIMADIREANELGPDIAKITDEESKIWTDLREILLPIKAFLLKDLAAFLQAARETGERSARGLEAMNVLAQLNIDLLQDAALGVAGAWKAGLDIAAATTKIKAIMEDKNDDTPQQDLKDLFDNWKKGPKTFGAPAAAVVPAGGPNIPIAGGP